MPQRRPKRTRKEADPPSAGELPAASGSLNTGTHGTEIEHPQILSQAVSSGFSKTGSSSTLPPDVSILPSVPSVHKIGMHISNTIRQKIIEGQYIELVSLLPPRPGGDEEKLILNNLSEIVSKEANPPKIDTIEQWADVMFTFAGMYASGHPSKAVDLVKYMQTVRMGPSRWSVWWKEYEIQYRQQKAENPASSWVKVDSELWLMYMVTTTSPNTHQVNQKSASLG
jgi:hypothetical protein